MRVCTVKLVGRSAGNVLWRAVKREEGTWSKISSWYRRQWDSSPPLPPYYHVCQIGDPVLRHEACSLTPGDVRSARVQQVIRRLREVLHKYNAVGLSAPQIGVPLKIFVVEFAKSRKNEFSPETYNLREMSTIPLKVFVNPEVKVVDYEKVVFPEACESVRGFHADVPRYRAVVVSGLNEMGAPVSWEASGWAARIVQHEADHLRGRLYTDVMLHSTLTCSCWQQVNAAAGRLHIPFTPRTAAARLLYRSST